MLLSITGLIKKMTHSKPITARYSPLDQKEGEVEIVEYPASRRSRTRFLTTILIVVVICSLCGYVLGARFPIRFQKKTSSSHNCVEPAVRREWRSLSSSEKQDYISAVQCLRSTPSRLNASQSLYDDFPYVHAVVGGFSHGAAAFLSWHRAFLHIFEQALEEECQYAGNLVYWDWTLDWTNLTAAPVWAEEDGFGGNGNRSATSGDPIRSGYCVSDGPFADLQVLYYGPFYRPHCLSRGFEHGRKLDRDSTRVKPEMIESLMKCNDYESFNLQLEDGPHMSIPRTVNGDFALFTAPYGK